MTKNLSHEPFVDKDSVVLPPLHLKLDFMKNFVKAMDCRGFQFLLSKFPAINASIIKEGILIGPQIRHLMKDTTFEELLTDTERSVWLAFKDVCNNFLGNVRADNYRDLTEHMLDSYQAMGCNMSLKLHFLHSHLIFPA